jgi:hypothetical protein
MTMCLAAPSFDEAAREYCIVMCADQRFEDEISGGDFGLKFAPIAARFLRRGFPYGFSRGIPGSAYTERYPIPASAPITLWLLMSSGKNLKNTLENIVRMERREIATRYTGRSGQRSG